MEKSLLKSPLNNSLFDFDNDFKESKKTPLGFELDTYTHILGTDEAGRGPAAGGVWAACVCFLDNDIEKELTKLNDSKKLSEKIRLELYPIIRDGSVFSIKSIDVETIEKINILNSSLLAMKLCIEEVLGKIQAQSPIVLVDGNKKVKGLKIPQKNIIKGDSKSASIAAASILAKVERDEFMKKISIQYPNYHWEKNKGYLSKEHIEAIKKHGVTKYHRKSFLRNILN